MTNKISGRTRHLPGTVSAVENEGTIRRLWGAGYRRCRYAQRIGLSAFGRYGLMRPAMRPWWACRNTPTPCRHTRAGLRHISSGKISLWHALILANKKGDRNHLFYPLKRVCKISHPKRL